jgi:predicted permease
MDSRDRKDDFDKELRTHLDLEAEEQSGTGIAEGEANYRARRAFGNVTLVAEDVRAIWRARWLEDAWQDIRYGLRMLRKSPGFTAVAILTLALSIGANTAMYSIADAVLWRTLPYSLPERLVVPGEVSAQNPDITWGATYPTFRDWQSRSTTFERLAGILSDERVLRDGSEPVLIRGAAVSYDYFDVMGVPPAAGRVLNAQDDSAGADPVIVLSHRMWAERYSSDSAIIGRTIHFATSTFIAIGVMPTGFDDGVTDYWVPLTREIPAGFVVRHDVWVLSTVGRLRPGRTAADAQAELEAITAQIRSNFPSAKRGLVVAVPSLRARTTSDIRPALLVLLGAVGLVLLIACGNLAALISVRVAGRGREFAIRSALGGGRRRLVAQLLTESALLSFAGGAAGVALAFWATRSIALLSKDPRLLNAPINSSVLLFALAATIFTSLLAGIAPALHQTKETLIVRTSGGNSRHAWLQQLLVVGEVTLCLVLLVGAGLLFKTLHNILDVDPGFRTDHLVTMRIALPAAYTADSQILQFYRVLPERLQSMPGIDTASVVTSLPLSGGDGTGDISIEGRPSPPGSLGGASFHRALPNYFRVMGIPLLRGREFDDRDDGTRAPVVVITERMAQVFWPNDDPIGKRIKIGPPENNPWLTIVGVVKDIHHAALDGEVGFSIYEPLAQGVSSEEDVAIRTLRDPAATISAVRSELRRIEPGLLVDRLGTLDQRIEDSVSPHKLNLVLFGVFSGLALLLASIGLYGVVAYYVGERTHEFGIRMALGAQQRGVFRLVVRQGLALAGTGLVLGLIVAAGLTRFLASLLFHVRAFDPITYGSVSFLLGGVALLASYIPARRATRVDPLVALRNE